MGLSRRSRTKSSVTAPTRLLWRETVSGALSPAVEVITVRLPGVASIVPFTGIDVVNCSPWGPVVPLNSNALVNERSVEQM